MMALLVDDDDVQCVTSLLEAGANSNLLASVVLRHCSFCAFPMFLHAAVEYKQDAKPWMSLLHKPTCLFVALTVGQFRRLLSLIDSVFNKHLRFIRSTRMARIHFIWRCDQEPGTGD